MYCERFPLNDMPNRNLLHKLVFLALPLVLYFFSQRNKTVNARSVFSDLVCGFGKTFKLINK